MFKTIKLNAIILNDNTAVTIVLCPMCDTRYNKNRIPDECKNCSYTLFQEIEE